MNRLFFAICLIVLVSGISVAQEYRVSLPENIPPVVIDKDHGILVDLFNAMNKLPNSPQFRVIGTYPFSRAIENVLKGDADIMVPMLKDPNIPEDKLPFAYSTGTFNQVIFVLYTNSSKAVVSKTNYKDYNVYVIPGHMSFFPGTKGEMTPDAAFRRLSSGDIDGYIGAMDPLDPALKQTKATNIKRQVIAIFEAKAVIAKGPAGKAVDKAFSESLQKLKTSGALDKIYPQSKFVEW